MKQNFSESNWPLDESVAEVIPQLDLFELEQFPQYPGALADWKPEWLAALPAKPRSEQCDFRIEAILESSGLGDWPLFVLQVGLWGRMIPGPLGRSYQRIYGSAYGAPVSPATFDKIDSILSRAFVSLQEKQSLEAIWNLLGDELAWSAVMRSKCLHFMARAAGWEDPVPVPIDNAMSRNWLWPRVRQIAHEAGVAWPRPGGIRGEDWVHYKRYMTMIRLWSNSLNWTCTELETALFAKWRAEDANENENK
jgi:hypothetical protein